MKTNLAIILVNYNNSSDTIDCIKSLEKALFKEFKVFLVDNGSSDADAELLNSFIEKYSSLSVELIHIPQNLGFAGGNNVAIRKALDEGFDYFWLLNNDTEIDPDAISPLIDKLKGDSKCAAAGSRILYWNTNKIWFAGGYVSKWTGKAIINGKNQIDSDQYSHELNCDYITGCSLMTTRTVLEKIGFMDEGFFLYYEETDWCARAVKAGYKMCYCPESYIYHKVGMASGGYSSPFIGYYNLRNRFRYISRNYNIFYTITSFLYLLFKAFKLSVNTFRFNKNLKRKRLKAILLACIHAVTGKMGKYTG